MGDFDAQVGEDEHVPHGERSARSCQHAHVHFEAGYYHRVTDYGSGTACLSEAPGVTLEAEDGMTLTRFGCDAATRRMFLGVQTHGTNLSDNCSKNVSKGHGRRTEPCALAKQQTNVRTQKHEIPKNLSKRIASEVQAKEPHNAENTAQRQQRSS